MFTLCHCVSAPSAGLSRGRVARILIPFHLHREIAAASSMSCAGSSTSLPARLHSSVAGRDVIIKRAFGHCLKPGRACCKTLSPSESVHIAVSKQMCSWHRRK